MTYSSSKLCLPRSNEVQFHATCAASCDLACISNTLLNPWMMHSTATNSDADLTGSRGEWFVARLKIKTSAAISLFASTYHLKTQAA